MHGYRLLDHELAVQMIQVPHSNLVRRLQIGQPTGFADAGGEGARRESVSRGDAVPKLTEFCLACVPGPKSTRGLAGDDQR